MKKLIKQWLIMRALEKHAYWKARAESHPKNDVHRIWNSGNIAEEHGMAAKYMERAEYLMRMQ